MTKFSLYLSSRYGNKLKVNCEKVHDYMGMDLDFPEKGTVKVSIIKYLNKILASFPEEICGTYDTPSSNYLFHIREEY